MESISDINKLRLKGGCFFDSTDLEIFEKKDQLNKASLIFGRNGAGKTTLSNAFRKIKGDTDSPIESASLIDYDNKTIDSNNLKNEIFVFDEKFIDENVKIKERGLRSVVILGKMNEYSTKLDKKSSEQNKIQSEVDELNESLKKSNDQNNTNSPEYYWNKISKKLKEDGGWADRDKKIRSNVVKSKVSEKAYDTIKNYQSPDTIYELNNLFDSKYNKLTEAREGKLLIEHKVPSNDIFMDSYQVMDSYDGKVSYLLNKKLEKPTLNERDNRIISLIYESSNDTEKLSKKLEKFEDEKVKQCPYCYQDLSDSYKSNLVKIISRILNQEVKNHQNELRNFIIEEINIDLSEYVSLGHYDDCIDAIDTLNSKIENNNEIIRSKINNPYDSLNQFNSLNDDILALKKSLNNLEIDRKQHNKALVDIKSIEQELISLNNKIAYLEIKDNSDLYEKFIKERSQLENKIDKLLHDKSSVEDDIADIKSQMQNVDIAVDKINAFLEYIFCDKEKLKLTFKENEYLLMSKDKFVKPSEISLGERNILGLSYFFVSILENKKLEEGYKKPSLIVIDDPISSFDNSNKIGIISFLKFQMNQFLGGNENTKAIILTHDLSTYFSLEKLFTSLTKSFKNKWDKKVIFETLKLAGNKISKFKTSKYQQYDEYLETIYKFATDVNTYEMFIGNIIRQVLEAFSTFEYGDGIDAILDGDITSEKLNNTQSIYFKNLMFKLFLDGGSHKENDVKAMNDFNFFTTISHNEKRRVAKDILCLLYKLNEEHFISHFKRISNRSSEIDINEVLENINEWSKIGN